MNRIEDVVGPPSRFLPKESAPLRAAQLGNRRGRGGSDRWAVFVRTLGRRGDGLSGGFDSRPSRDSTFV